MRGKPPKSYVTLLSKRITPAHAGKTSASSFDMPTSSDHPRACGENLSCFGKAAFLNGSPPRMRGKLVLFWQGCFPERITPAHAGKTACKAWNCKAYTDHPRACGENNYNVTTRNVLNGSPPRMRGKQGGDAERPCCPRITPAHAGKTLINSSVCLLSPDHPRACGENFSSARA